MHTIRSGMPAHHARGWSGAQARYADLFEGSGIPGQVSIFIAMRGRTGVERWLPICVLSGPIPDASTDSTIATNKNPAKAGLRPYLRVEHLDRPDRPDGSGSERPMKQENHPTPR